MAKEKGRREADFRPRKKGLLQLRFEPEQPHFTLRNRPKRATPVAASLVLTPAISVGIGIGPLPIVAVDMNPYVRWVVIGLLDMPAIAGSVANNGG
jgi:hypothetical protein